RKMHRYVRWPAKAGSAIFWRIFNVGSDGSASRLCPGRARFRPPDLDGARASKCAGEQGNQGQGYRIGAAKLAGARHPDRQLLQEPVRAANPFYMLIALALPLRHADLVIVALSWVFVVTRFVHAGIFVTSNDLNYRSLAWFAGVLVVFVMWVYFALKILL